MWTADTVGAMQERPAEAPIRTADLRLRGVVGRVRARVCWPQAGGGQQPVPPLLVLLRGVGNIDPTCRELCAAVGVVVLSASVTTATDAVAVAEWARGHAGELAADPGRVFLAGAELADAVARHIGEHGWPAVTVLRDPDVVSALVDELNR
jgi:hypothetical protein